MAEAKTCLIEDCLREDIEGRGLCKYHYMRARRKGILGSFPKGGSSRQPIPEGIELREIPSLEGYLITPDGKIYGSESGTWLKTEFNRGYFKVSTSIGGKRVTLKISHLVLITYVGPRPEGTFALHKDDDPTNNHYTNLYWGTQGDNAEDSRRNNQDSNAGVRKFSSEEVNAIRKRYSEGETMSLLSREYEVDRNTIRNVVLERTYRIVI